MEKLPDGNLKSIKENNLSKNLLDVLDDSFKMQEYEKLKKIRQLEITDMCKNCIKEYMEDYFSQLPNSESTQILRKEMSYMYEKRFNKEIWLRPFVVSSVADFFAKKDVSKELVLAIAASEVFNISTYQTNLLFDNKINDDSISGINQVSVSMISMSIANKMLQDLDCAPKKKLQLIDLLNKNNGEVYIGQNIDLNTLIIKNVQKILNMEENNYLKEYKERCDYMGGTTVENCAAWGYLLGSEDIDAEKMSDLKLLFRKWGGLMQKINDLSDFVVFKDKPDFVRYTDVKAGKITLPFYYILKDLDEEQRERCLSNIKDKNKEYLDSFFQEYLYKNSGVIKRVVTVIMDEWNDCVKLMKEIGLDSKYFQFMYNNAFFTKFTKEFFDIHLLTEVKKELKNKNMSGN